VSLEREFRLPEFDESSIAAVHLLQGAVYHDEIRIWGLIQENRTRLDGYFNRIGLRLVIDDAEGFAFLRQLDEGELSPVKGYDQLPKLFRKKRLSYDATLLCVLLREELRRFEEEQVDNERCVVATADLFEHWKSFFSSAQDDVKSRRALEVALKTLEELKFVREFAKDPDEWEIRRILKARIPAAELERLCQELKSEADARSRSVAPEGTDE
jgi:Domain of unknown function (DUF4194)